MGVLYVGLDAMVIPLDNITGTFRLTQVQRRPAPGQKDVVTQQAQRV
jgi:hypothetical protein